MEGESRVMGHSLNKRIHELTELAQRQGFRVRETKCGFMIFPENRSLGAVAVHSSPSDTRGVRNAEQRLKRIGLVL